MSLLKATAIKQQVRDAGFRLSKDALPQFERKIALAIQEAIEVAKADNRKTLQAQDVV